MQQQQKQLLQQQYINKKSGNIKNCSNKHQHVNKKQQCKHNNRINQQHPLVGIKNIAFIMLRPRQY